MAIFLVLLVWAGVAAVASLWLGTNSVPAGFRDRLKGILKSLDANPLYPTPRRLWAALGVFSAAAGLICFAALWVVLGRPLLALPGGLAAAALPFLYWRLKASRLRRLFERQLAEALALLGSSLKSGVSFPQALEALSRESRAPLGPELESVVSETRLGRPVAAVLEAWAKRVQSRSLEFVVAAISISQTTGGSLAGVLQNVAGMIRKSEQLKERARSLSAEGKLSGYVVGGMPFGLMAGIGFIAPDTIAPLFTTDLGNGLFLIVCLLVGVGLYFIHRLVDIEV